MAVPATLSGRTCLVTGATSGIGLETALGLARRGARVLCVGRNEAKGENAVADIVRRSGNDAVELLLADLSSQAQIRALAAEVESRAPALHLLVNNAGLVNLRREITSDGLEATFAVNHLAYFLLTRLLLERLVASAPARIVNVASDAQRFGSLDFDDLQSERRYQGFAMAAAMRVYGTSKLANILFTTELARRLEGSGVTANCVHPGAVATGLGTNNGRFGQSLMRVVGLFMRTPEQGAATSLYAATSPELEGVSGRYYANEREAEPVAAARDTDDARRLWAESSCLVGLPED
jgi:NAD(P)-dependent dehydrogenase (short-subunit alcohol dehydrogenase family)